MRKQFATSIREEIIKELKLFAVEKNQNYNEVIENALCLYLSIAKDKDWNEITNYIPSYSFNGAKIQNLAHEIQYKNL